MKANEAPEKIILSADRDTKIIYDEWVAKDLTDNIKIEYIRTDAFIEKVLEFFENDLCCYIKAQDFFIEHGRLKEDFENFIKGL